MKGKQSTKPKGPRENTAITPWHQYSHMFFVSILSVGYNANEAEIEVKSILISSCIALITLHCGLPAQNVM